jgi:hypothetical protein
MSPRQRGILLVAGSLVLLFILAAGLTGLELKPGRIFDFQGSAPIAGMRPVESGADFWATFLRGFVSLVAIITPIYIIYMLLDPKRRKRLLSDLIIYAFFILAFILLQNYLSKRTAEEQLLIPTPTGNANFSQENGPTGEQVNFDAQPSELIISTAGILIGIVLAAAAVFAWWLFFYKLRPQPHVLAKVASEAEETLESILSGKDLRETILLCYRKMTEVVVKNRGIPREASVTPHEFEQTLIEKGLPAASVRDLTHLFEDVRYGDLRADEESRRRATLALRTVIAACRKQEEPAS